MSNLPDVIRPLPVIYADACKALAICTTIDEAKYFSDKAEALAAWARIYKSNQAATEARRLKLHAFRRMSQLSGELRPMSNRPGGARAPGPVSLLMEHGITNNTAKVIRAVGSISKATFNSLLVSKRIPTPREIYMSKNGGSACWLKFKTGNGSPMSARTFARNNPAESLARGMEIDEAKAARALCEELIEWLEEMVKHLPTKMVARK